MEKVMKRDKIDTNDRQLACARINSQEGQDYLKGMASAANYAWVNRSSMTFLARQVSCQIDLDYKVIYYFCVQTYKFTISVFSEGNGRCFILSLCH